MMGPKTGAKRRQPDYNGPQPGLLRERKSGAIQNDRRMDGLGRAHAGRHQSVARDYQSTAAAVGRGAFDEDSAAHCVSPPAFFTMPTVTAPRHAKRAAAPATTPSRK